MRVLRNLSPPPTSTCFVRIGFKFDVIGQFWNSMPDRFARTCGESGQNLSACHFVLARLAESDSLCPLRLLGVPLGKKGPRFSFAAGGEVNSVAQL